MIMNLNSTCLYNTFDNVFFVNNIITESPGRRNLEEIDKYVLIISIFTQRFGCYHNI